MKADCITLKEQKRRGAHYTPTELADFVAVNIVKTFNFKSDILKILDPAVGDGELLLALINSLMQKHTSFEVYGFDTNPRALESSRERFMGEHPEIALNLMEKNFLEYASSSFNGTNQLPLFASDSESEKYDLIISNPPYVRTQVLGQESSQLLSNQFGLTGRIDLFFPFIMSISWCLKTNGVAGIIVSNRFMTTKAGQDLRSFILREFEILHIWDFGDTQLFEAAVLPCVLLLKKRKSNKNGAPPLFTSSYICDSKNGNNQKATSVIDAVSLAGHVSLHDGRTIEIKQGKLNPGAKNGDVWSLIDDSSKKFMDTVSCNQKLTFGEISSICVGIKTTADKVFIKGSWEKLPSDKRPETLKPLITHHISGRFRALSEPIHSVLYTHKSINGKRKPIDLDEYPNTKEYLTKHKQELSSRKYLQSAGRNWYEIWVPHQPHLWPKKKIVFRDICVKPAFWLDNTGAIVNGDCYWLVLHENISEDFLWLILAVANSSFIERYYDTAFNNKLYSGRRRYITQYVEKFPLPDINKEISQKICSYTKDISLNEFPEKEKEKQEKVIDSLVWESFGFSAENVSR